MRHGVLTCRDLVGMFAIAIADRVADSLFLARDRFGEKPLFIHESRRAVTFASEVGPLMALPDIDAEVDEVALGAFLCLNYVPSDRTLAEGIRRIPPASWCLYGPEGVRRGTYWTPPVPSPGRNSASVRDLLPRLQSLVDDAVRIALRSDVPVALFLSGGIDSSVIAASAARQGRLKHAYCLDFSERSYSELANADSVARALGLELRHVTLTPQALEQFFAMVERADDPLADSSALAVWTLAKAVAEEYKVVLTGDGGDELFGGYLTYRATALHGRLLCSAPMWFRQSLVRLAGHIPAGNTKVSLGYKLRRFLRAASLTSAEAHFTWNGAWLPEEAARLVTSRVAIQHASHALVALKERHGLSDVPTLGELQRIDLIEYLPNDILTKVDRMTMAHGLEARSPFLVPGVAEFALALPDHCKLTLFGHSKRILRELALSMCGERVSRAKKQGFSIPIHQWLRGLARSLTEDLLSERSLSDVEILDPKAVIQAKEQHLRGHAQLGFELWGLMVLIAWYRARIRARPALPSENSMRRLAIPLRN